VHIQSGLLTSSIYGSSIRVQSTSRAHAVSHSAVGHSVVGAGVELGGVGLLGLCGRHNERAGGLQGAPGCAGLQVELQDSHTGIQVSGTQLLQYRQLQLLIPRLLHTTLAPTLGAVGFSGIAADTTKGRAVCRERLGVLGSRLNCSIDSGKLR
jgi:hypothetical protein